MRRSILHRDADNIMHCVVHGRKDWILIHPDYEKDVDMVPSASNQNSGYSHLPVDAIDETINPEVWDVPWEYATLRAGDCLYLPPLYLHQVFFWILRNSFRDFLLSPTLPTNLQEDLPIKPSTTKFNFAILQSSFLGGMSDKESEDVSRLRWLTHDIIW